MGDERVESRGPLFDCLRGGLSFSEVAVQDRLNRNRRRSLLRSFVISLILRWGEHRVGRLMGLSDLPICFDALRHLVLSAAHAILKEPSKLAVRGQIPTVHFCKT